MDLKWLLRKCSQVISRKKSRSTAWRNKMISRLRSMTKKKKRLHRTIPKA